jgi:hypothetical protein
MAISMFCQCRFQTAKLNAELALLALFLKLRLRLSLLGRLKCFELPQRSNSFDSRDDHDDDDETRVGSSDHGHLSPMLVTM